MPNILMTRRALAAATIALSLAASAAFAQQPGRIRAQIEKADGGMLVLKTRDGAMVNAKFDDKSRVTALVKASLDDIKPDTWIGIAGIPKPDGSIEAFSIHIPPAALRGEGRRRAPVGRAARQYDDQWLFPVRRRRQGRQNADREE